MSSDYVVGAVSRLSVSITDVAGVAADPGALRLKIKPPSGAVTTYTYGGAEIIKDAVGHYRCDVVLTAAGSWIWRGETDAPNPGAAEGSLAVRASKVI